MGGLLLFCILVQNAAPLNPTDLLLAVRKKVLATLNKLPKYLCTETTDRSTFQPETRVKKPSCEDLASRRAEANWKIRLSKSDRLRLDVAISSESEMYSWVGENRFGDHTLADLVGSGVTSTGDFGDFLSAIFGTKAATFSYIGETVFNGRTLAEFGFDVPRERSSYIVGNVKHQGVVPYEGKFLVDPSTFDLVRLTIRADKLPEGIDACEDLTTLDYSTEKLHDSEFLLPKSARLHVTNSDGSEFENRSVFSGCHEFRGESTVRFDYADGETSAAAKPAPKPLAVPPGLAFTLALAEPIDPATAAAGDLITAKLTSALGEKHSQPLVAKGAAIRGRIMRIEWHYGPRFQSLTVALKLESIESEGVFWPFEARLLSEAEVLADFHRRRGASAARQDLRSFDETSEPAVSIIYFRDVTDKYVIHRGFSMEGRTISASSPAPTVSR